MKDLQAELEKIGLRKTGLEPYHFVPLQKLGLYQRLTAFRGLDSPDVVSLGGYKAREYRNPDAISFKFDDSREAIKSMLRELDEESYGVLEVLHQDGWAVFFSVPGGRSCCYETETFQNHPDSINFGSVAILQKSAQ